jgi:hypothetical protein
LQDFKSSTILDLKSSSFSLWIKIHFSARRYSDAFLTLF